jgi:hypothetical protein
VAGPVPFAVGNLAAYPYVPEKLLQERFDIPGKFGHGKYVVRMKKTHEKLSEVLDFPLNYIR